MDKEYIMLYEMSDRKRQTLYYITYMQNIKYNTNKCILQNRNRLTETENLWLSMGKGEGLINQEPKTNRYTLLYTKQINNTVFSILSSIMEKNLKRIYIHIHVKLNHFAVHQKLTHYKSTRLQLKSRVSHTSRMSLQLSGGKGQLGSLG